MVAGWRLRASLPLKSCQALKAFRDALDPAHPKHVCAPCGRREGALRDILGHYAATAEVGIHHGGRAALILNAVVDVKPGLFGFDEP